MNHLKIFSWRLWVLWWANKLSFCWCSHDTYFPLMIVIMCSEELTTPSPDHAPLLTCPGSGPASPVWMFGPFLVRTFLMLSTHAIFWSSEHRHHHHKLFINVSLQTVIWVCHILDMGIFKILSMRNIKYEYWIQDSGFALKPIIIHDWNYYSRLKIQHRLRSSAEKTISLQMRMHLK